MDDPELVISNDVPDVESEPEIPEEDIIIDEDGEEEPDVQGNVGSSIQVAPTDVPSELETEYDPMMYIQLGDRILIDSKKYGRTIGTVYYRSLELIRIKPDGVSNHLHDFHIEQTEDEEIFDEEDGISAIGIITKRMFESFVEQRDFRVNQIIDTFDSDGKMYKSYKIIGVDKENDSIKIHELENEEEDREIAFNFIGIEQDEPFTIISIREFVGSEEPDHSNDQPISIEKQLEEEEEENEEENEEEDIEVIGYIEVTKPKIFKEAASYEQQIPDYLQKIDALNDFVNGLDPSLQKDPKAIRSKRILVETLFHLKQEIISYNEDGSIRSPKQVSVATLAELIQHASIPLGRPVLNIVKKAYITAEEDKLEEKIEKGENIYFENFENELDQMIKNPSKVVSSAISQSSIIQEWNNQQSFLKQYLSPWSAQSKTEPLWSALSDSDFFRNSPPKFNEMKQGIHKMDYILPGYIASHESDSPPIFDKVPFGLERALSTTYRKGADRKRQALLSEEGATMDSYLLFPLRVANYLGTKRSNMIAIDSGRSQLPPKTMRTILEEIGEPQEVGTSRDLILLDVTGQTLGNIPLADYIGGLSVPSLGLGDTYYTLNQYGLQDMELNKEIADVLLEKIKVYQSQLLATLDKLRDNIQSEEVKEPELNPLFEDPDFLKTIRSQPILSEYLDEYIRISPSLSKSDIGMVSHLLKKNSNYFQVTSGQNPLLIAKANLEANNLRFIEELQIDNLIKFNKRNAGKRPIKNTCEHVAAMVSVRKITDDTDRFKELIKKFRKYQGKKTDNWFDCNICNSHLLCLHERLQLDAFINPKDKSAIEKDILLNFSGGQFQGKYICRNCGQAIKDLDFDNNIEFDDEGRPKSGRAVLVDEDAEFEEKLDNIIGVPIEESEYDELKLNEDEKKCYEILREISERVGVQLDKGSYRNSIRRIIASINKFPSRDIYANQKKANPKLPDYDLVFSRNIIYTCAVHLLLEIQMKMPPYVIRYALMGCKSPGFEGYPLDPNPENKQGVEYIACAISSIRRNDTPWNQSGLQQITDVEKRIKTIVTPLLSILKTASNDDAIQSGLAAKRKYVTDVLGVSSSEISGRPRDMIPTTFLPEQIIITPEDAAKDVISPEVLENMGNKGKKSLVRLWIRQAHRLAKETASLIRGSPLSETTCCLSTIQTPNSFWSVNTDLPPIGNRSLIPNQQGQFLVTSFIPRESGSAVAQPNEELYFRIFLKYCFQGPRIGFPHEPGLTNRCTWCGFQFPSNPSVMDTDKEGKASLITQEVKTDTEHFTQLLDTIHTVNDVKPIDVLNISSIEKIMNDFGLIDPPPLKDWRAIIGETTSRFLSLPPNADRGDIANALGPISDATTISESIVSKNISSTVFHDLLDDIAKLSWINFFQVIQVYFITSIQRLLSNFSKKSIFIPIELTKALSEAHTTEDLQPILDKDLSILSFKEGDIHKPNLEFARSKLRYFLKQLSMLLPYKNTIRPIVIPGRSNTLEYIQRAILYGTIGTLLNSDDIPSDTIITSSIKNIGDPSIQYIRNLLITILNKYKNERISYDDQQIRDLIAIRDEKERVNVVNDFNNLTDEEKVIELMNKRLGLGKWAVGGTKLIYAYDKDYYDLERQKRINAGIIDVPGLGQGEDMIPLGREHDEFGMPVYDDEYYEQEGGYDHNEQDMD